MGTVDETLAERGTRYGPFEEHAKVAEALLDVFMAHPKWGELEPYQREAIRITCNKYGRIFNGDHMYDDSWHDVAGYNSLVAKILRGQGV